MDMEIYCDESRQDLFCRSKESIVNNDRYICIGGIWLNKDKRTDIKDNIKVLKENYNVYGEIKWKNVSITKLAFYKNLIDLFFLYDNCVRFRCIVVDSLVIDLDKWHNSDAELGFYKFYYQLLYQWISNYNKYYIFTDYKINKKNNRIIELKDIINRSNYSNPIKTIQAVDSKESLILQLEDLIMGAIGYKYNFNKTGKSVAKNEVVKTIEKYLGCEIKGTNRSAVKFNIFKMDLNRGGI